MINASVAATMRLGQRWHAFGLTERGSDMTTTQTKKRTLLLDFDGVIHSYTSGWVQHNVIPDPPVPGAFAFIAEAVLFFEVAIYSSRSSKTMGIEAMRAWFTDHGLSAEVLEQLTFPLEKPPAFVTLDDRAITFTGVFPSMADLDRFRTWMQMPRMELAKRGLEKLLIAIADLRDPEGRHIALEPRSVLQQWVLDQVPEWLR